LHSCNPAIGTPTAGGVPDGAPSRFFYVEALWRQTTRRWTREQPEKK
jgi:hypothetical protein